MESKNLEFYLYNYSSCSSYEEAANALSLPPLLKRKLSKLDKMTFFTFEKCMGSKYKDSEIVFSSKWGEFDRLLKIISQYQNDNEVSPNAFSASVHNFAVSYFTILNKIHSAYSSLAAGVDTLSLGFLSAITSIRPNKTLVFNYSDVFTFTSNDEYASVCCAIGQDFAPGARHLILEPVSFDVNTSFGVEYPDFVAFLDGKTSRFISKYFILQKAE